MLFCSASDPTATNPSLTTFLFNEKCPIATLFTAVVLVYNDSLPIATLLCPVVLALNAEAPIPILLMLVFFSRDLYPIPILPEPLSFKFKEKGPIATFCKPLVSCCNVLRPKPTFEDPVTLANPMDACPIAKLSSAFANINALRPIAIFF